MTEDLYAVMGVAPTATQEQIDAAYRRLARQYHPDVNPAPEAVARMQAINNAYATLRDPERRAQYDRSRLPAGRVAAPMTAAAAGGYAPPRRPRATVERRSGTPDEMPKVLAAIIGAGVLIFLLTVAWIVTSARRVNEERAARGLPAAAAAAIATPTPHVPTATVTRLVAAAAATVAQRETPTPGRVAAAPASAAGPSPTTPPATPTAETATPEPTGTPTETPTATASPRPSGPPLALAVSDLYNEQENRAGGRRFQFKLTIANEGQQTLNPPWRPSFLIYAGQRRKGWVEGNYYSADRGGVDLSQQPAIKPGQEVTWAWYTVTLGPDEWVYQVEFDAQGWRWVWTFDTNFQNPELSVSRQ